MIREGQSNREGKMATTDKERGKKMVDGAFAELGINISEYPETLERLGQIALEENSHFRDSAQMAEIIDRLWPRFGITSISKDKMRLSALLHDIGKSGPVNASPELRAVIGKMFTHDAFKSAANLSIREALEKEKFKERFEMERRLKDELEIDVTEEKMIEFWRRHAEWGYDILKKFQGGVIDEEVALIAGSHHIFQHKNPAHINLEKNQLATIVLLAMVDEYQAFRARGGAEHDVAISKLREVLAKSHVGKRPREMAGKVVEILANSEEDLKQIFG